MHGCWQAATDPTGVAFRQWRTEVEGEWLTLLDGEESMNISAFAVTEGGLSYAGFLQDTHSLLVQLDAEGTPTWVRVHSGAQELWALAALPDGGVLVGGSYLTNACDAQPDGVRLDGVLANLISRLDAQGTELWSIGFAGDRFNRVQALEVAADGTAVASGQVGGNIHFSDTVELGTIADTRQFVIGFDIEEPEVHWARALGSWDDAPRHVPITALMSGAALLHSINTSLTLVEGDGENRWTRDLDWHPDHAPHPDGGFVGIVGQRVTRYDRDGEVVETWDHELEASREFGGARIIPLSSGGFLTAWVWVEGTSAEPAPTGMQVVEMGTSGERNVRADFPVANPAFRVTPELAEDAYFAFLRLEDPVNLGGAWGEVPATGKDIAIYRRPFSAYE